MRKKILLFLTSCVVPHNDMPSTVVKDYEIRKKEYLESIEWYLQHTTYDLAVIDSSGFDFTPYTESKRFVIIDSFIGGDFDLALGKGYGEGRIILRLLKHKIIDKYDVIIKISGRHIILNINSLSYVYRYLPTKHFVSAIWSEKDGVAISDCFFSSPSFLRNVFGTKLEMINESMHYYFEHALSDSIKQALSIGYRFIFPIQPLRQLGISGSTGAKLKDTCSAKSRCAYIKNFIFSFLRFE